MKFKECLNNLAEPSLWVRRFLLFVSVLVGLVLLATAWGGNDILSPVRRSVAPYESWLNTPEKHGLVLTRQYVEVSGISVPVLVVNPGFEGVVSDRGRVLHQQLGWAESEMPREIQGSVILFHGHKGRKEFLLPVAERFAAVGLRCIIPDLPAHGEHPSKQVHFGHGVGEGAYLKALLPFAKDGAPIHVWGMSMGGSFAMQNVVSCQDQVDSLILLCAFENLDKVMLTKTCSYLGDAGHVVHGVTRYFHDEFGGVPLKTIDNRVAISKILVPTLILHGDADDFILEQNGKDLYESLASPDKRYVPVEGAGHYDLLTTPQQVYREMIEFMNVRNERSGGEKTN